MIRCGLLEKACGFLRKAASTPNPKKPFSGFQERTRAYSTRVQIMAISIAINLTIADDQNKNRLIDIPAFLSDFKACLQAAAYGKVHGKDDYRDLLDRGTELIISLCYDSQGLTPMEKMLGNQMYERDMKVPRSGTQGRQYNFAKAEIHMVLHDLLLDAIMPQSVQAVLNAIICFMGDSPMRIIDCEEAGLRNKCKILIKRFHGNGPFGTIFLDNRTTSVITTCKHIIMFMQRRAVQKDALIARRRHDQFIMQHENVDVTTAGHDAGGVVASVKTEPSKKEPATLGVARANGKSSRLRDPLEAADLILKMKMNVTVVRKAGAPLGIAFLGGYVKGHATPPTLRITRVRVGSVCDGLLKVDDLIRSVNGTLVNNLTHEQCAALMGKASGDLRFGLERGTSTSANDSTIAAPRLLSPSKPSKPAKRSASKRKVALTPEPILARTPALVVSLDPGSADAKIIHGKSPAQKKLEFVSPSKGRKSGDIAALMAKIDAAAAAKMNASGRAPWKPAPEAPPACTPFESALSIIKASPVDKPPTYLFIKNEVIKLHGSVAFEKVKAEVRNHLLDWSSTTRESAVFTLRAQNGNPYVVV